MVSAGAGGDVAALLAGGAISRGACGLCGQVSGAVLAVVAAVGAVGAVVVVVAAVAAVAVAGSSLVGEEAFKTGSPLLIIFDAYKGQDTGVPASCWLAEQGTTTVGTQAARTRRLLRSLEPCRDWPSA